jgi:hypothetical protein
MASSGCRYSYRRQRYLALLEFSLGLSERGLLALSRCSLIATSLTTVYAYVFLAFYRSTIVFVAVSGALGVLFEVLFFERDRVPPQQSNAPEDDGALIRDRKAGRACSSG